MSDKALVIRQIRERTMQASVGESAIDDPASPSHSTFHPACPVALAWDVGEKRRLRQAAEAFELFQRVSGLRRKQRRALLMKAVLCVELLAVSVLAVAAITGKSASSRPASAVAQWCLSR
jgi:hypothetical protein